MFDVKKNLNKLKKHSGFETQTDSNIDNKEYDSFFNEPEVNQTQPFIPQLKAAASNSFEFELGIEKLRSELKDSDKSIENNFSSKIQDVEKSLSGEIQNIDRLKLNKEDFKWWIGGILTVALIISSLIYTLSYSKALKDIDELDKGQDQLNIEVQKIIKKETDTKTVK